MRICQLYDSMKLVWRKHIESNRKSMIRQIVQIFHNLIGKGIKSDGQTHRETEQRAAGQSYGETEQRVDGQGSGSEQSRHDRKENSFNSGGSTRRGEAIDVRMVDRKDFERIVNESVDRQPECGCLLIGDVDKCRDINNIYGYEAGDAVLQYVSETIGDVLGDFVWIGSGDSDAMKIWMPTISRDNEDVIRRRIGIINDRLLHPPGEVPPSTLSVGAVFCRTGDDCKNLMKTANEALGIVKGNGRCGFEISM